MTTKIKKSQLFQKPHLDNINNSQKKVLISLPSAKKVVSFLLKENELEGREMSLHFIGKKKIASLHAQFFDDPTPTDCITFPIDSPSSTEGFFLGEVFVCPEVASEYVDKSGGDLYEEITLYVVHGFLHLLGFDDQTPKDKQRMRKEEKKWMAALIKNNLLITK